MPSSVNCLAMKKIKSIQQLSEEKTGLREQRDKLENKMINDWKDISEMVRPANTANSFARSMLKKSFVLAAVYFTNKFSGKFAEKVGAFFKK